MSIRSKLERGIGYLKEEAGEMFKNRKMTNEGRAMRNKGRLKDGKMPKSSPPGSEG